MSPARGLANDEESDPSGKDEADDWTCVYPELDMYDVLPGAEYALRPVAGADRAVRPGSAIEVNLRARDLTIIAHPCPNARAPTSRLGLATVLRVGTPDHRRRLIDGVSDAESQGDQEKQPKDEICQALADQTEETEETHACSMIYAASIATQSWRIPGHERKHKLSAVCRRKRRCDSSHTEVSASPNRSRPRALPV